MKEVESTLCAPELYKFKDVPIWWLAMERDFILAAMKPLLNLFSSVHGAIIIL